MSTDAERVQGEVRELIGKYAVRTNLKALWQVFTTLVPYFALFYLSAYGLLNQQYALFAGALLLLILFIVRVFMVMHDCGHGCLFRTRALNQFFGFVTGVIVAMPQYVWSKHHAYHHATNGNWQKYRGPLAALTVAEYAQLKPAQQRVYRSTRHILFAPVGAFMYFIFNPRVNWLKGTAGLVVHVVKGKLSKMAKPVTEIAADYQPRYWNDRKEYWHMTGNNIVLLSAWWLGCVYFGVGVFFTVYLISLTLAGAIGILVFTIQHNFEHAYAEDDKNWSIYEAAIYGTSFLTFPAFFHWFGLNIAYHHIHHLSSRIPNYNLAKCHREYADLFTAVKRIRLRDVPKTMKNILWDTDEKRIITIAEYDAKVRSASVTEPGLKS